MLATKFFTSNCDSLQASMQLYLSAKENLFDYLNISAYRKRNKSDEIIRDTQFCLNPTINSKIVPIYIDKRLIKAELKSC